MCFCVIICCFMLMFDIIWCVVLFLIDVYSFCVILIYFCLCINMYYYMVCYSILWHVVLLYVVPYCFVLLYVVLSCVTFFLISVVFVLSHDICYTWCFSWTIIHRFMSIYVLISIILCCVMSFYNMLCYYMLFCVFSVLLYVVLC